MDFNDKLDKPTSLNHIEIQKYKKGGIICQKTLRNKQKHCKMQ